MLKLMKYEFRKNRTVLLVIAGGLLLLQLYYMYNFFTEQENCMILGGVFLMLYAMVCYFTIFILAVTNYSRELNSKSSYLIFMTPNSSYTIIFSKMLTILLLGMVTAVLGVALICLDVNLYSIVVPEADDFARLLEQFLKSMGIHMGELLLSLLSGVLTFLVYFFSTVSVVYLSVTLSATFLQNSKLKHVISVLLFLGIFYVMNRILDVLPLLYDPPANMMEVFLSVLPATGFSLLVLVLSIFACGRLLDKKVSL